MSYATTRVKKACQNIIFGQPFYGSLLPRLVIEASEKYPTMATDASHIWYNEEFVDRCQDSDVRGVLIHEILHCIFLHPFRRGDRCPKKWQLAIDYAANPFVIRVPGCTLPEGGLLDETRFPLGMPAEVIYDRLNDDEVPQTIEIDIVEGGSTGDPIEAKSEELDWRGAVAVAAQNAKQAGALSKELEDAIERMLHPKLPWSQLLHSFMTKPKERFTTWNRANRRYIPHRIFLPGSRKHLTGDFIISYDVSGSMSNKAISESLTEVGFIINEIKPNSVILIEHDADITAVQEFSPYDELPTSITIHGRGGTDFRPVFNYVDERDEIPEAIILFTDGYGPHPEYPPEYPVLWVLIDSAPDMQMNFGEQIWLDS